MNIKAVLDMAEGAQDSFLKEHMDFLYRDDGNVGI